MMNTIRRRSKQGARLRRTRRARLAPMQWLNSTRHWLGLLLLLGLGVVAVQQGRQLLDAQKFPLRYVYLQGEWHYLDPSEVRRAVLSQPVVSFFVLDIEHIQQRLNAMPWIQTAIVQRRWPDGLDINLKERRVFARWGEAELIDPNGQRFQPEVLPESKDWPLLNGPKGQERQVLEFYQAAHQRLRNIDLSIAKLEQDARGAWRLQLNNGLKLKLGKIQLVQRLERFVVLYPKVLQAQLAEITEVDLRYNSGLAVRWNRLSSTAPLASAAASRSASASSQPLSPRASKAKSG